MYQSCRSASQSLTYAIEQLLDLRRYNDTPADGGVISWPMEHTQPDLQKGSRDITFTILAQGLVEDPDYEPPKAPQTGVPVQVAEGAGEAESKDFQVHDAVAHDAVVQSAVLVEEPDGGEEGTATTATAPEEAIETPTVLDAASADNEQDVHDEL
jgi:hypothetical protein